ncbi:MAG TPA: YceI family protein [Acidimicrobiia bacterium]|jgi:polyisoprenoid-binding protein YceI|nr:YceI family protein [Acidimicrobiia bacterium]
MTETLTLPAAGTWSLDPAHTVVGFSARHLMAAKVRGTFKSFSGEITIGDSPENSSVTVSIDAGSIDTGVEDRDGHLRSPDFLNIEEYATLEFASTAVRQAGTHYEVDGDLTIRDITNPVTLKLEHHGLVTDPWGNNKALFSASTKINREDWGLTWNAPLEAGGWLVGKDVTIELEVQAAPAS